MTAGGGDDASTHAELVAELERVATVLDAARRTGWGRADGPR